MYEAHFGLSGQPFQLNPDPAFYFNSRGHGHALAYLRYGVSQGEGFIVVTGEIGAGKTTLVRTLLGELDRQQVVAAQIVSTQLDSGDLLQAIITAFGIPAQGASKAYTIATLEAFLTTLAAQGRRALLIVDEAQNLNRGAVEELRMLSNFQLGHHSLLQSFLVGQPELRRILEAPDMEQLRQRISASCHLGPLDADETRAYIEHRLHRVGWSGRPTISAAGFDQLYRWSGGVPRRINRLANRVLLATFLDNRAEVDAALVENTARELRGEIGDTSEDPAQVLPRAAVAAAAARASTEATEATGDAATATAPASITTSPVAAASSPAPVSSTASPPHDVIPQAKVDTAERLALDDSGDVLFADLGGLGQLVALDDIERVTNSAATTHARYLLALADTAAGALKLAALSRALAARPHAPTLLLVTPGLSREIWPWDEMERLLPRPPLALHLGIPPASFEQIAPLVFERFGQVLGEFNPAAVLVAGAGDSLLAAALLAYKRGLPLARLDAGDSEPLQHQRINCQLIDPLAQRRYDCVAPGSLAWPVSPTAGSPMDADHQPLTGSLLADVCQAVEPGITTPAGACLRNNLSIYLGPDWSREVQGTPYAAVALSLPVGDAMAQAERIEHLLACTSVPKLLWLVDGPTEAALRAWQAQTQGELAEQLFMVDTSLSRDDARYRRRLASANVLSCRVSSLADQFSLLRGALALVSEPGQLLGEVARLWKLPCALVQLDGRWIASAASSADHEALRQVDGRGMDPALVNRRAAPALHEQEADRAPLHDADTLDAWLGDLASAGYAACAAQAAIHAAATAAGARTTTTASGAGAAAVSPQSALASCGVAAALADSLSQWLTLYTPASWTIEA
jgi:putative secretion ATPase (PEP-CTERM system associated)